MPFWRRLLAKLSDSDSGSSTSPFGAQTPMTGSNARSHVLNQESVDNQHSAADLLERAGMRNVPRPAAPPSWALPPRPFAQGGTPDAGPNHLHSTRFTANTQNSRPQQMHTPTAMPDLERYRAGYVPAPGVQDVVRNTTGHEREINRVTQSILNRPYVEAMERAAIESLRTTSRRPADRPGVASFTPDEAFGGCVPRPQYAPMPPGRPSQALLDAESNRRRQQMRAVADMSDLKRIRAGHVAAPGVRDIVRDTTGHERQINIGTQSTINRPWVEKHERESLGQVRRDRGEGRSDVHEDHPEEDSRDMDVSSVTALQSTSSHRRHSIPPHRSTLDPAGESPRHDGQPSAGRGEQSGRETQVVDKQEHEANTMSRKEALMAKKQELMFTKVDLDLAAQEQQAIYRNATAAMEHGVRMSQMKRA